MTNIQKSRVCALLRSNIVPTGPRVADVFKSLGYHKAVVRTTCTSSALTVRTTLQTIDIMAAAQLAEYLRANDVTFTFSRTGLILMFKYA